MVLLAVIGAGPPSASAEHGPWAALVGPVFARFVPGTSEWKIGLVAVGERLGEAGPRLGTVRATLDGRPLPDAAVKLAEGIPWIDARGRVTAAEVMELKRTAREHVRGRVPDGARDALERTAHRLAEMLGQAGAGTVIIGGVEGVPEGVHTLTLTADYHSGSLAMTVTEEVQVLVASVPTDHGWFPADLHMHSTFSDGNQSVSGLREDLTSMGYAIGYVTDHTDALMSAGVFDSLSDTYPSACAEASDTTTSMFPGAELAVGHYIWIYWNGDGHILAYGIDSTYGLDDNRWGAQVGLDKVNDNNPPLSSPAIAHPTHLVYDWDDYTVLRYNGIELMSGYQWYFDINSGPVERWRSECERLLPYAESFRPSVRSGSDYHTSWYPYVTHVKLPTEDVWYGGTWTDRWTAVSAALRDGRTVTSRKGSLAFIQLDGFDVGSSVYRSSGDTLSFSVYFEPIESGNYTLTLYRGNCAETVWSTSGSYSAGTAYTWEATYTYPGGSNYFWLYVSGPDYCYTTPIYVNP
jgi:hypothetical protein